MTEIEALVALHAGLERKGPGTEEITLEALARCRPLPSRPVVLDLGCGSGAAALALAQELRAPVTAIDLALPFLRELHQRVAREGLRSLVRPVLADFGAPPVRAGSVDLIWSEGAIYNLGWENGLRRWAPLLRPGGWLAVTEATWLVADPPEDVRQAWDGWYPGMGTVDSNLGAARGLGLTVVDARPLPAEAWWAYYRPVIERCAAFERDADETMRAVIAETRREIALFERNGDAYGYVFYLLRAA
ncbi:MAG: class I SAM-dependent methyltransferase [Acidobacteriota bacterium]